MIRPISILFLLVIVLSCEDTAILPKPKAQLSLQYSRPDYIDISTPCSYQFKKNTRANFELLDDCESKLVYPKIRATVYLALIHI